MRKCTYQDYKLCSELDIVCKNCPYTELEWEEGEHKWESERDERSDD